MGCQQWRFKISSRKTFHHHNQRIRIKGIPASKYMMLKPNSASQPGGWQIAQSRECFCDFGRKLENLSLPVYPQWCSATDGRTRLLEPRMARWTPFTSLREKVKQAGLAFLIFGQRNKTGTALRNLSINKPERTICANNIIRYITESQKRGSVFFYPFFT